MSECVEITAHDISFAKAAELGAAEKAIIFTESRKTQSYLLRLLADSPYAEGIVLFNGTNTDDSSKGIFTRWAARHAVSDKITGSRNADMRSALVDYFREESRILIATEAGASIDLEIIRVRKGDALRGGKSPGEKFPAQLAFENGGKETSLKVEIPEGRICPYRRQEELNRQTHHRRVAPLQTARTDQLFVNADEDV